MLQTTRFYYGFQLSIERGLGQIRYLRFMEMDIYREWMNILKSIIMSYTESCH